MSSFTPTYTGIYIEYFDNPIERHARQRRSKGATDPPSGDRPTAQAVLRQAHLAPSMSVTYVSSCRAPSRPPPRISQLNPRGPRVTTSRSLNEEGVSR